jgi:hypothetical protein
MEQRFPTGSRALRRALAFAGASLCLLLARGGGHAVITEAKIHVSVENEQGEDLPGHHVKLVPQSTAPNNVALPAPEVEKDQTGHDADPLGGVTPPGGVLILAGPPEDFGLPAEAAGGDYELTMQGGEQTSRNFLLGNIPIGSAFSVLPRQLNDYLVSIKPIAGNLAVTFTYPVALDAQVRDQVGGLDEVQEQEENGCMDKQPALPASAWPPTPPGAELPGATLQLAGAEGT